MKSLLISFVFVSAILCASSKSAAQVTSAEDVNRLDLLLQEASELSNVGQFEFAYKKLDQARILNNLTTSDVSAIDYLYGKIARQAGHSDVAVEHLSLAIDSGVISGEYLKDLEYQRALALISDGQYSKGADKLGAWMSHHGTTTTGLESVVVANIMIENFDAALPWALKWKDEEVPRDKALKVHKILDFIYQKLGRTDALRSNLDFMVQNWPDDKTVYIAKSNFLRSQSDKVEEYNHFVQMYDRGMLETEDELYYFISLHLDNDNFEKAREVFDKETKAGRISDNPDHSLSRFLASD